MEDEERWRRVLTGEDSAFSRVEGDGRLSALRVAGREPHCRSPREPRPMRPRRSASTAGEGDEARDVAFVGALKRRSILRSQGFRLEVEASTPGELGASKAGRDMVGGDATEAPVVARKGVDRDEAVVIADGDLAYFVREIFNPSPDVINENTHRGGDLSRIYAKVGLPVVGIGRPTATRHRTWLDGNRGGTCRRRGR